jgi:hypothetical protein
MQSVELNLFKQELRPGFLVIAGVGIITTVTCSPNHCQAMHSGRNEAWYMEIITLIFK